MSLKSSTLVSFQSGYVVTDNLITILANQPELFGGSILLRKMSIIPRSILQKLEML